MSRNLTLKTLVSLLAVSFITLPVFAQQPRPPEGDELPRLRTQFRNQDPMPPSNVPAAKASPTGVNPSDLPMRGAAGDRTCKPQTGQIDWNWDNVKLADLVTAVSRVTCKSFILSDPNLANKKITILSRTKVTAEQAWQSFLSALESNNMATVKTGAFYKIQNTAGGVGIGASSPIQKSNTPIYQKGETIPADEGYITMIYDVRNISKTLATSLLKEMLKTTPVEVGDFLVFTDTGVNVKRAMKALEIVDVPGAANRLHVIDLEFAPVKDMKARIDEFFGSTSSSSNTGGLRPRIGGGFEPAAAESSAGIKIVADERTNKLLILASDKTYLRIREFIDKLDVRASGGTAQFNIYQLQNQKVLDVEKTITGLLGSTTPKPNQPRLPYGQPAESSSQFEGEIKVKADEKTNTLVVSSSRRDFNTLSEVLNKLDRRRPQVFVEAVILEISTTDLDKFGFDFYSGFRLPSIPGFADFYGIAGNGGGQDLAGRVISGLGSNIQTNTGAANVLSLGNFISTLGVMGTGGIPVPGGGTIPVPSVGALINFLTTFSNLEIIATPSLMTIDNEESEIRIGEKRPMSKAVSTAAIPGAAALNTLSSNQIEMVNIENKLKIKTAVKENDEILMEITQDIMDLGEKVDIPGAGQANAIRTKFAQTRVMAADQQTVVVGGLINKQKTHSEKKIPFLGDIPVLGYLFKRTEDNVIHSNLLLVLTPYVIRSPADTLKIYERKKKEHEDMGKLYFGDKITRYNPSIDYTKKPGPIAKMLHEYDTEMLKLENGGPGQAGEIVIRPEEPEVREEVLKGIMPDVSTTTTTGTQMLGPIIPMPVEPYPEQPVQAPPPAPPVEVAPPATPTVTTPAPAPNVTPPAPIPVPPQT